MALASTLARRLRHLSGPRQAIMCVSGREKPSPAPRRAAAAAAATAAAAGAPAAAAGGMVSEEDKAAQLHWMHADECILVDEDDNVTGHASKLDCAWGTTTHAPAPLGTFDQRAPRCTVPCVSAS